MSDLEQIAQELNEQEEGGVIEEPQPSSPSFQQILGLTGLIIGLLAGLFSCALGPLLLLATVLTSHSAPDGATIQQSLALTVLGLGLGGLLAWEGWQVWQGRPSLPFAPRRVGLLWLAFGLLLLVGLPLSLIDAVSAYLLPPLNTLAMILLPVLLLAVIGQVTRGRGGTWRDATGGLLGGAALGTGLAMIAELLLAGTLLGLALALGWIPGGIAGLEGLLLQMEDPAFFSDPQNLVGLLSPLTVVGTLAFIALLIPIIEEITKTVWLGIAGPWVRPSPARAFVVGVASGAGFALAENLLNGAVIGTLWGPGIIMRLGATLMHCATGGLMGWGWGQMWTGRRPLRLALAFLGAIALHGTWNGLAVGIAVSSLLTLDRISDPVWMGLLGLLILTALAILVVLALAALVGLLWSGWALARREATEKP